MPATTRSMSRFAILNHICKICKYADDTIMAEFMKKEGWETLEDIVMIPLEEVNDFKLLNADGTFKGKPLTHHLRKFKAFILYYHRKCKETGTILESDDVLNISVEEFVKYCLSTDFHSDLANGVKQNTTSGSSTNVITQDRKSVV